MSKVTVWHRCLACGERTAIIGDEKLPTTCPYCRKRWAGMTEDLYNTIHNLPAKA